MVEGGRRWVGGGEKEGRGGWAAGRAGKSAKVRPVEAIIPEFVPICNGLGTTFVTTTTLDQAVFASRLSSPRPPALPPLAPLIRRPCLPTSSSPSPTGPPSSPTSTTPSSASAVEPPTPSGLPSSAYSQASRLLDLALSPPRLLAPAAVAARPPLLFFPPGLGLTSPACFSLPSPVGTAATAYSPFPPRLPFAWTTKTPLKFLAVATVGACSSLSAPAFPLADGHPTLPQASSSPTLTPPSRRRSRSTRRA